MASPPSSRTRPGRVARRLPSAWPRLHLPRSRRPQVRILCAAGLDPQASTAAARGLSIDGLPATGQVLPARRRQWLVEDVVRGEGDESPLVRLVYLDDDDPGRQLDVLWDLE